jgi:hypothetical protein
MVYFDDIFIYRKNLNEHVKHLKNELDVLRKECLYANLERKKCNFCMEKIFFLDYIVNVKCIEMDEENVRAIQK